LTEWTPEVFSWPPIPPALLDTTNLERNGTMAINFLGDNRMAVDINDMGDVSNFTMSTLRELVLSSMIMSLSLDAKSKPSIREVDNIVEMAKEAVTSGQVIDCGHLPNQVLMDMAKRGGDLYKQKAIGHPFRTPWMILHSWSDPTYESELMLSTTGHRTDKMFAVYLVNPLMGDSKSPVGIDLEILCLDPMTVEGKKILLVGDRTLYSVELSAKTDTYACFCVPSEFRTLASQDADVNALTNRGMDIMAAAAANCIDPIFTILLMLNTRGVRQEIVTVSDKLNKARLKSGKPPIPPYRKIDSADYVNLLMARHQRGEHKGGTHASPVPHIRIGHWRNYKTGERSFINDTLVRVTPEMREEFKRSHYKL
jgi:hypothetical protein